MQGKSKASLSLDLDNQWSYMKTHGDDGWQSFPSYFDLLIPRVLEVLQSHGLKITFFIVGQDAELDKNQDALKKITDAGHEVGNHSFHHEPWLHLYSDDQIAWEIKRAEDAIFQATGQRPTGFRGPGFSVSKSVLETLHRAGYHYDASTFPTFLGPLARAYYFFSSKLSKEEMEQRKVLFGRFSEGFRPLKPYDWTLSAGRLLEIPVTTMPLVKAPFHVSYLLYLGTISSTLARAYFLTALKLCKLFRIEPSLLLHPLDFLGHDDIDALKFFPGMSLTARQKLVLLNDILTDFRDEFDVLPMGEHAEAIKKAGRLPRRQPNFATEPARTDFQGESDSAPGKAG